MLKKAFLLGMGLMLTVACLGATPGSTDAVGTAVAKQLTAMAALTKTEPKKGKTPQGNGNTPEAPLPSVTPTGTLPPSATPTVSPTATPSITNTPPADDPRLTLGTPTYRTDFADATNLYLYEDDNLKFDIVNHQFVMLAKNANGYDGWSRTAWKLTDYYLEITATPDDCSGRDRYGVVVGIPEPAYNPNYLLRFSCDGYYSFGFFNSTIDNKFHFLQDWTKSNFINAGPHQTNRMGFKAEGTHLSFYANGHFLSDLTEPDFAEGYIGLVVGSVTTANFTVRLSEIAIWKLP